MSNLDKAEKDESHIMNEEKKLADAKEQIKRWRRSQKTHFDNAYLEVRDQLQAFKKHASQGNYSVADKIHATRHIQNLIKMIGLLLKDQAFVSQHAKLEKAKENLEKIKKDLNSIDPKDWNQTYLRIEGYLSNLLESLRNYIDQVCMRAA